MWENEIKVNSQGAVHCSRRNMTDYSNHPLVVNGQLIGRVNESRCERDNFLRMRQIQEMLDGD